MDVLVSLVDIVFRGIRPETLQIGACMDGYQSVNGEPFGKNNFSRSDALASAERIPLPLFLNAANRWFSKRSREECERIFDIMTQAMEGGRNNRMGERSVFNLLLDAAEKFLCVSGDSVYCKSQHVLDWQQCYLNMGQDIFTTARYAAHDLRHGICRKSFVWPTVIRTQDDALYRILQKGIAENHSHLGGTSQPFPIMWAYLMNHPRKIDELDTQLQRNLQANERRSWNEETWSWTKRMRLAAWIRMNLFCKIKKITLHSEEAFWKRHILGEQYAELSDDIDTIRQLYGLKLKMSDDRWAVLDYALEHTMIDAKTHVNRLLAGERNFLYQCFRKIFSGEWSTHQKDAFYLYLLLKSNFRGEIVQVNREYGFTNFKEYQDRKGWFYENDQNYDAEMTRLAINSNMEDYSIQLFETRIGPGKNKAAFEQKIEHLDTAVKLLAEPKNPYYYVVHFIRIPENGVSSRNGLMLPRNARARESALQGAKALQEAMVHKEELRYRILGIDAASTEIGCHPEVFARVFRGLKTYTIKPRGFFENTRWNEAATPRFVMEMMQTGCQKESLEKAAVRTLGVTYHAGEDFYDMADGLRSIDEAIRFLKMERGARIGHALAMGVEPQVHYATKNMRSVLPKQEYLDNLIWIMFKCEELEIAIEPLMLREFETIASRLMDEIYGPELKKRGWCLIGFRRYYFAWCLRGDPPEWYEEYRCDPTRYSENFGDEEIDQSLDIYRRDDVISYLYGCYHFSEHVRQQGAKAETQPISKAYVSLIRSIQEKMMYQLGTKGISVECNPTSNYLIGTFRDYGKHPLFRFYPIQENSIAHRWIKASINTDDLGVFDTSIENEYMVLAAALREKTDESGKRLYSDDEIEHYLDMVRENGMQQSFWNQMRPAGRR